MAMFMPISWSEMVGPVLERSTETLLAMVTVAVDVAAGPPADGVTVSV